MRIRCSLDVDGVIADFDEWCLALFGAKPRELTHTCPETGAVSTGDAALWKHVDAEPSFWLEMPLKPNAHELVEMARPYGVQFLTGCPKSGFDRAVAEKTQKLNRLFPGIHVQTCLSKLKPTFMQRPGDILVDDFIANIKRWEKAGGHAVYYKTHGQALADLERGLRKQFPNGV